jgi:sulfur carrier protein
VTVNGAACALVATDLGSLLRSVGYDTGRRGIAVAVNGAIVRRDEWERYRLHAGDAIDVVGAVQGG